MTRLSHTIAYRLVWNKMSISVEELETAAMTCVAIGKEIMDAFRDENNITAETWRELLQKGVQQQTELMAILTKLHTEEAQKNHVWSLYLPHFSGMFDAQTKLLVAVHLKITAKDEKKE